MLDAAEVKRVKEYLNHHKEDIIKGNFSFLPDSYAYIGIHLTNNVLEFLMDAGIDVIDRIKTDTIPAYWFYGGGLQDGWRAWKHKLVDINSIINHPKIKKIGNLTFRDIRVVSGELKIGSNIERIEKECFKNLPDINKIEFSEGLKVIGNNSFVKCDLAGQTVVLPRGLKAVGEGAFGTSLFNGHLYIPDSVEYISGPIATRSTSIHYAGTRDHFMEIFEARYPENIYRSITYEDYV